MSFQHPVVMQLLGRWLDYNIVFPLPPRTDFYGSRGANKEGPSYIVINQFVQCKEHTALLHFPVAQTSLYPGAVEGDPQPIQVNPDWYPGLSENQLLNWNLDAALTTERGEERVRRQAPTPPDPRGNKLLELKNRLGPNDNFVNAYFYNPKISKSWSNYMRKSAKNFILNDVAKNFAPTVASHFSNVWPQRIQLCSESSLHRRGRKSGGSFFDSPHFTALLSAGL